MCLVDGVSDTLTKEYMHFHAIVAKPVHVHYTPPDASSLLDKTKPTNAAVAILDRVLGLAG